MENQKERKIGKAMIVLQDVKKHKLK